MKVFSPRVNSSASRRDFPVEMRGVGGAKRGLPRVNSRKTFRVRDATAMRVSHACHAIRHEFRAASSAKRADCASELGAGFASRLTGETEDGARAFVNAYP